MVHHCLLDRHHEHHHHLHKLLMHCLLDRLYDKVLGTVDHQISQLLLFAKPVAIR